MRNLTIVISMINLTIVIAMINLTMLIAIHLMRNFQSMDELDADNFLLTSGGRCLIYIIKYITDKIYYMENIS